jgi:hypothetical protein
MAIPRGMLCNRVQTRAIIPVNESLNVNQTFAGELSHESTR